MKIKIKNKINYSVGMNLKLCLNYFFMKNDDFNE